MLTLSFCIVTSALGPIDSFDYSAIICVHAVDRDLKSRFKHGSLSAPMGQWITTDLTPEKRSILKWSAEYKALNEELANSSSPIEKIVAKKRELESKALKAMENIDCPNISFPYHDILGRADEIQEKCPDRIVRAAGSGDPMRFGADRPAWIRLKEAQAELELFNKEHQHEIEANKQLQSQRELLEAKVLNLEQQSKVLWEMTLYLQGDRLTRYYLDEKTGSKLRYYVELNTDCSTAQARTSSFDLKAVCREKRASPSERDDDCKRYFPEKRVERPIRKIPPYTGR